MPKEENKLLNNLKQKEENFITPPYCFMEYICSSYNTVIYNILKTENEIILSLKFDYDTLQSWIHISDGEQEFNILTPQIPTSMMSNIHVSHKAANAQRIIDSWFDAIKESIEYSAYIRHKKISVKIENTCIYSRHMFWSEYDKENENSYYIAHKYIKTNHPDAYIKEKAFFDSLHWIEKPYESAVNFTA